VVLMTDGQSTGTDRTAALDKLPQKRAEVVTAIVQANDSMTQSAQRLSNTVVELVTRAKEPVALPAGPQLPVPVLDQLPAGQKSQAGMTAL
jgi:hypothetical protein